MYWDVVDVKVKGDKLLHVAFSDGLEGDVEFNENFFYGIFEKFKSYEEFAKVMIIDGAIGWSEETDLAPDHMYQSIKSQGKHVVHK